MAGGGKVEGGADKKVMVSGLQDSSSSSDKKERKNKKKDVKDEAKDVNTVYVNTVASVTYTDKKVKKRKQKKKSEDKSDNAKMSQTEEKKPKKRKAVDEIKIPHLNTLHIKKKAEKSKDKKRKTELNVNIPNENESTEGANENSEKKRKENRKNNVDKFRNKNKVEPRINNSLKLKVKAKDKKAVKILLEHQTNFSSSEQVKRIKSIRDDISYEEVFEELVQSLRGKASNKTGYERNGKDTEIAKIDEEIKMLKKEAVEKASELNSQAINKLESAQKTINRKMKRRTRKKTHAIGSMSKERFSKGKTGLGKECQDRLSALHLNSNEARSQVREAVRETKEELKEHLKAFATRVEKIDIIELVKQESDPAFSGAVIVKGYLS